ncbi:MAG: beta-lactamase family protein [Prevotellaceae bacterium]|jgi:CubicO group peptidase (beta-lactamase class C family)|nr:beta-lactamase family protein [Prevotellaceae bacterium]
MLKPNYLCTLLAMSVLATSRGSSRTESDNTIIEKTREIATEAKIPLMQLEYHDGNHVLSFEISQRDSIAAREDCSTVFQAASLSKPVFAYIVLKMVDNGEIGLDDPICKYTDIDRFVDKERAAELTPRMVLSHRTGLPNWAVRAPSSDEWVASPIGFLHKPDTVFAYSGEAFAFLQRAIEKIRGKSLQQIAAEEVFIPFDMPNSSFGWKGSYDSLAIDGYNSKGESVGIQVFPRENCGYTLRTTAKEYSHFIQNVLVDGRGLKPETHRLMLCPTGIASGKKEPKEYDKFIEWGLGIGIEHNEELGDIYHHWGDNGNFKALFIVAPKVNKYLIYLTNSHYGHDIINQLTSLYFGITKPLNLSVWIKDD